MTTRSLCSSICCPDTYHPLSIIVLDPIDTTGLTTADVDELCKNTRDLMLRELIALTAKARGQSVSQVPVVDNHPSVAKTSGTDMRVAA